MTAFLTGCRVSTMVCYIFLGTVLLLSVAALLPGWLGGVELFVRGPHDGDAMVPSSALVLGVFSLSLILLLPGQRSCRMRKVAKWMVRLAFLIPVANLILLPCHAGGMDKMLGVNLEPGDRMAPATCVGLILAAMAIRALHGGNMTSNELRIYISVLGLSSFVTLMTFMLTDKAAAEGLPGVPGMSATTLISLILLFGAVIAWPDDRRVRRPGVN